MCACLHVSTVCVYQICIYYYFIIIAIYTVSTAHTEVYTLTQAQAVLLIKEVSTILLVYVTIFAHENEFPCIPYLLLASVNIYEILCLKDQFQNYCP